MVDTAATVIAADMVWRHSPSDLVLAMHCLMWCTQARAIMHHAMVITRRADTIGMTAIVTVGIMVIAMGPGTSVVVTATGVAIMAAAIAKPTGMVTAMAVDTAIATANATGETVTMVGTAMVIGATDNSADSTGR